MAFSLKPYKLGHMASLENPLSRHDMMHYQGGPLGIYAIAKAINAFDIVVELLKGTKAEFSEEAPQNSDYYTQAQERQSEYSPPRYGRPQQN